MLSQTLAVDEAFSTISALVGSLPGVKPVVHLQLLGSGVAFPTHPADERSIFNVGLVMCCEIRVYPEFLPADGAGERLLSGVLHLVQLERGRRVEASTTLGAEERFLPSMEALVNLDVTFIDELLATVGARVRLLLDVGLHMLFQLLFFSELNAAAAAEEKL